jgi:hypothetical protein
MQQLHKAGSYKAATALADLEDWITLHVNRPIKGFEHKRNKDGTLYTKSQQITSTRYQAMAIAAYFTARGKTRKEILEILEVFC